VNQFQRSMQIWSILVFAAQNQKLISYTALGKLVGVPTPALGRFLFPILYYCQQNDLPPLTSIVISHVSGTPGEGFPPNINVPESQSRSFVYDWQSVDAPNADQFQAAQDQHA